MGALFWLQKATEKLGAVRPFFGKYTNSSTNPVNVVLKAQQLYQCDQQLMFNNPSNSFLCNWIHEEEVAR